jgi:predicted HAD superfamily Cof-like phosphohydrolase
MNSEQKMVLDWHERFGARVRSTPGPVDPKTRDLRIALIKEELGELEEAGDKQDLTKIADAIADLLYVVYGTAVSYGIDIEPIFQEVHRSNMSKGDPEIVRASNGKILKSKNWTPPDLEPILKAQTLKSLETGLDQP